MAPSKHEFHFTLTHSLQTLNPNNTPKTSINTLQPQGPLRNFTWRRHRIYLAAGIRGNVSFYSLSFSQTMTISDNPRLEKSRTVKSRYLSPVSAAEPPQSLPPSPNNNHPLSPNRHHSQKPKSSLKNSTGLLRGVWPSSTPRSSKSHNENISTTATATTTTTASATSTTLADYLGDDRKKDGVGPKFLKQRSCSEFSRFENDPKKQNNLKENHKPIFGGGSMRYTGKFRFPGRSSTSSSPTSSDDGSRGKLTGMFISFRFSVNINMFKVLNFSHTLVVTST